MLGLKLIHISKRAPFELTYIKMVTNSQAPIHQQSNINGLLQDCGISIADALETQQKQPSHQSSTKHDAMTNIVHCDNLKSFKNIFKCI